MTFGSITTAFIEPTFGSISTAIFIIYLFTFFRLEQDISAVQRASLPHDLCIVIDYGFRIIKINFDCGFLFINFSCARYKRQIYHIKQRHVPEVP